MLLYWLLDVVGYSVSGIVALVVRFGFRWLLRFCGFSGFEWRCFGGWLLVIDLSLIVLILLSFFVCFIVFWVYLWLTHCLLFVASV